MRTYVPGLALAAAVAAVATLVGRALPLLGAPVCAAILGVVLATALPRTRPAGFRADHLTPGLRLASRPALQAAVVLLGAQVSLGQVLTVGAGSLPVMLTTVLVCLAAAAAGGRALGVDSDLRTLIGIGTAICGASAIAAVTPVLRPAPTKVAYALSTVFVFNIAAVLLFGPLGHLLGMSQAEFGLFAGTAVNDMSSVVAAATSFGPQAAHTAVVVKLARTLLIIPICAVLAAIVARRARASTVDGAATPAASGAAGPSPQPLDADSDGAPPGPRLTRLVPWFLGGFLVLAAANSAGLIPAAGHAPIATTATFLITMALAAIGLSTDLPALRAAGARPLLLGAALWLVVTLTSLGVQALSPLAGG